MRGGSDGCSDGCSVVCDPDRVGDPDVVVVPSLLEVRLGQTLGKGQGSPVLVSPPVSLQLNFIGSREFCE